MDRRKLAFLLIGIGVTGVGTILAVIAAVILVYAQHTFIFGFQWRPGSIVIALPFLMIAVGALLLLRRT